ncbi:MAG TPA: hypothetical protein VFG89_06150, partial [Coriobacteriia bacterium]|nr:hypothetical protein [Coriobacteriia bacterium]
MNMLLANPLFAVVAPIAIALLLALGGRMLRAVAPMLAAVGPLLTAALAFAALQRIVPAEGGPEAWLTSAPVSTGSLPWFRVGDVVLSWSWTLDSLSALMLAVVGIVALCVVVFSVGYMHGDKGFVRYFALISLFTG